MDENLAYKLFEKQLRRSEYHFYAVCVLFLVFMLFAYLYPVETTNTQSVSESENIQQEINNADRADNKN